MPRSLSERFWAKVDKTDDCWLWTGKARARGYGQIFVGPEQGRKGLAHRLSYEWAHGSIPPGLVVDHRCRNRLCVRPEHLQLVTLIENQQNRSGTNRNSSTGVRGVIFDSRRGKYVARAAVGGRRHFAGEFDSLADAERAVTELRNRVMTNNLLDRQAI